MTVELAATALIYPHLQEWVPLHWGIHGEPNGWGPRILLFFFGPGILITICLIMAVLPWLSPKSYSVEDFASTYQKINVYLLLFMFYLHFAMLWAATGSGVNMGRVIICGISLLMALMGNLMGKVRRNFYVGFRTPWTLASERVWNATHRFGARSMFLTGVIGCLAAAAGYFMAAMALVLIGALAPVPYSLFYSKKLERCGGLEEDPPAAKGEV